MTKRPGPQRVLRGRRSTEGLHLDHLSPLPTRSERPRTTRTRPRTRRREMNPRQRISRENERRSRIVKKTRRELGKPRSRVLLLHLPHLPHQSNCSTRREDRRTMTKLTPRRVIEDLLGLEYQCTSMTKAAQVQKTPTLFGKPLSSTRSRVNWP